MKRILTFVLALLILAGMGAAVFAASGADGSGDHRLWGIKEPSTTIAVSGEYVPATEETKVYRVSITWPNLNYVYEITSGQLTWDTQGHRWVDGTKKNLTQGDSSGSIIIANFSNAPVKITPNYTPASEAANSGLTWTLLDSDPYVLERCPVGDKNGTQHAYNFSLSGIPNVEFLNGKTTTLGEMTVTVSAPDAAGG